MDEEKTYWNGGNYMAPLPPEAQNIKDLTRIAGLIALILGIIYIIWGIVTVVGFVGIAGIIFGIIDLIMWKECQNINELIDQRKYKEAKDKTLVWMILGIILGGFIPGIILLISYIKYDELIHLTQQEIPPPPQ